MTPRNKFDLSQKEAIVKDTDPVIIKAIKSGNTQEVERLAKIRQLDEPNKQGETPLTYAISNKEYGVAQILIHLGCNVNKPNKKGALPLVLALYDQCEEASLAVKPLSRDSVASQIKSNEDAAKSEMLVTSLLDNKANPVLQSKSANKISAYDVIDQFKKLIKEEQQGVQTKFSPAYTHVINKFENHPKVQNAKPFHAANKAKKNIISNMGNMRSKIKNPNNRNQSITR
jgi:Ankyrin repeats (3 copies)